MKWFQGLTILLAAALVFGLGCEKKEGEEAQAEVATGEETSAEKDKAPSDEVQLTYKQVETGTTIELSEKSTMKGKMKIKAGEFNDESTMNDEEVHKVKLTLLPDENGATKRVKIEVLESYASKVNPKTGETEKTGKPTQGKTYTVAVIEGKTKVMTDDGKEAPEQEASAIQADYNKFFEKDSMTEWMASRKFKKNEEVDIPAEVIAKTMSQDMGEGQNLGFDKATMTLNEIKVMDGNQVAVFDIALMMNMKPEGQSAMPFEMDFELTGNYVLDVATGQVHGMTLEGPFEIATTEDTVSIDGAGEMKLVNNARYQGKS